MTIETAAFNQIREFIERRSGISLEDGKEYLVESRLGPILERAELSSLDELLTRIDRDLSLANEVVDALTTNETSFFRGKHVFEALRHKIVPELLSLKAEEKRLKFWSGACSSGQEPYSLAMTISEWFPQLADWSVKIIASDLSEEMIKKARAGSYRQYEIDRGVPAAYLEKYFEHDDEALWKVRAELRQRVEFLPINLVGLWPPLPAFDVILLRNVLIYFNPETKRDVLRTVRSALRPGGYLFLGSTETVSGLEDQYQPVQLSRGHCYRAV